MKNLSRIFILPASLVIGSSSVHAADFQCYIVSQDSQPNKTISTGQGINSLVDGDLLYQVNRADGHVELYVRNVKTYAILALVSSPENNPRFSLLLPNVFGTVDVDCQK